MISKRVSFPNAAFDAALWAAYRRRDKIAVTDTLFDRSIRRTCQGQMLGRQNRDAFRQTQKVLLSVRLSAGVPRVESNRGGEQLRSVRCA